MLHRDEVTGLCGKQGHMLGILRAKHPNKQHWPPRKVSEGQEPKVVMAKDIEHEGTQRKCSLLWAAREDPWYCFPVSFSLFDCPS